MKEKVLFVWLLAAVVFGLVFRHFWVIAIEGLGKVIATNFISLSGLAKFTAGIFGMFFLS